VVAEIVIRSYEPRDRAAVRHICCETADAGKPVEAFFHDRELIADLVTRYYTDFEPQHSWVAVRDGQVIGYLNGALDGRRALRVTLWRIVPSTLMGALRRATFCRREVWRLLWGWLRTGLARGLHCSSASGIGAAPHLHVNLLAEARGAQVGTRLVERFFEQVKASGGKMVEANVRGDNVAACRFFERLGFIGVARQRLVLPAPTGYRVTDTVTYAKRW
jgi:ribosomal protein S18 acetylase RimI-like enzyme